MKFFNQKKIALIFFIIGMLCWGMQKAEAATIPEGYICSTNLGSTGNCASLCASGLYEAQYEPSDGGFSGWVCKEKKSNSKECNENRNCTSSYCNTATKKCETNAKVTATELAGGSMCSTTEGNPGTCATSCASGLYEPKASPYDGGFTGYYCIKQKSTNEPCNADKECVSTTCDSATKKCVVKDSTYNTDNKDISNPSAGSGGTQIQDNNIPGTKGPTGIVPCGQTGGQMCTLCDMIKGINKVIQYLMKIAIGVALLAMAIGGVMYVISAGDSGAIENAKGTIKNAAIGFVIIFAAYLIVNTTIQYLGSRTNAAGQSTFGFNIVSWGEFDCTANSNR